MGLLDNLWDDTIAGPRPDMKKLRKYDSMPVKRVIQIPEDVPVSRSITIVKPSSPSFRSDSGSGSVPSSPAGSTAPSSPFSPRTPRLSDLKKLSRRKSLSEAFERAEPRSPTVYDWVVISALDR